MIFFGRRARLHGAYAREELIDSAHDLPLRRQAELLELSRSNVHFLTRPVSEADLLLMRRIEALHLISCLPVHGCYAIWSSGKALWWAASTCARG